MANEYPNLFKALIMRVPFVDVLTSSSLRKLCSFVLACLFVNVYRYSATGMLDESLPLTVHEYDEWGNPNEPQVFQYLKSYDPYFNIRRQNYPHILITASTLDIRVPYWQVLKFVAKLRAHKTDSNLLMLKRSSIYPRLFFKKVVKRLFLSVLFVCLFFKIFAVDTDVGHFGEGGRFGQAKESANEFAFLLSALNTPV